MLRVLSSLLVGDNELNNIPFAAMWKGLNYQDFEKNILKNSAIYPIKRTHITIFSITNFSTDLISFVSQVNSIRAIKICKRK